MALRTWEDKFSVGVRALDKQHTVLFGIVNELHTAMKQGKPQDVTAPLLRALADYARYHFAAEEALLMFKAYPGLNEHRLAHQEMANRVDEFIRRSDCGDPAVHADLMIFLDGWLCGHILEVDCDYGKFLSQIGPA